MIKKRIATAVGATVVAVAAATATPAMAAGSSHIWGPYGGGNMRGCPDTACSTKAWLPNYTSVTMKCWTDSVWAYGAYWTNRWFIVDTGRQSGWVHASLVRNQTSTPHC